MASKLSDKQLNTRDFILTVFRKEAPANHNTLKKLLNVYSDINNKPITEKYGAGLISSFLSIYKFKSIEDYREIMGLMKAGVVYDNGVSFYSTFHDIITKKLFDSESIKTEWIIEDISSLGSFFEINSVVGFLYTREKVNAAAYLNKIVDAVFGYSKDIVIYEAIIRHGMTNKKIDGLVDVFENIFSKGVKIETNTIQQRYESIQDKKLKNVVALYLYETTKDEKFLPSAVKDIFIF